MGSYALSREADADIAHVARESVRQWGLDHAEQYILGPQQAFERLAAFPGLGRDAGSVSAGYRQMETGRHVIFYSETGGGILIVRVLHQRMLPENHL